MTLFTPDLFLTNMEANDNEVSVPTYFSYLWSGKFVELDGVDDAIEFNDIPFSTVTSSSNIAFGSWARCEAYVSGKPMVMWGGTFPNDTYGLKIQSGFVYVWCEGTSGRTEFKSDAGGYDDGALRFYAGSINGSTAKIFAFDINGVGGEIASTLLGGSNNFDGVNISGAVDIGAQDASTGGANFFEGQIGRQVFFDDQTLIEADWQDWVDAEEAAKLTLWTPTEITTDQWLDASDTSPTNIIESGGDVSQWTDKSTIGTNHVTQGTGLDQPTTDVVAAEINGLNTIRFDGIDHHLINTSYAIDTDNISIFMVRKFHLLGGSNLRAMVIYRTSGATGQLYHSAGTTESHFGYRLPENKPCKWTPSDLNAHVMSYTKSGSDQEGWQDGDSKDTETSSLTDFTSHEIAVGSHTSGQSPSQVDIAEFIVICGTVDADTRQKIDGYLAWKWGLQANLPSGHPYEDAAPLVGGDTGPIGGLGRPSFRLDMLRQTKWIRGPLRWKR